MTEVPKTSLKPDAKDETTQADELTDQELGGVAGGLGTAGLRSMEVEPVDFRPKGSLRGMEVEPVDFIPRG